MPQQGSRAARGRGGLPRSGAGPVGGPELSAAGVAIWPRWGQVLVRGPDTWSFLQGLVSQDLDPVRDGGGARSLLLTPQGKVAADFRILRVGDDAWLDGADGPGLAASLARFKIRVDVEIEDRSGSWAMLSARGVDLASSLGVDLPSAPHAHVAAGDVRVVRAEWPGLPGADVCGPRPAVEAVAEAVARAGVQLLDAAAFDRLRIEAGIPLQGVDIDDRTIPQEAFLEREAVSFEKGCFLGQELVARIDTRGHVNRYLRRLEIVDAVPPAGAELLSAEAKSVGALTSVAVRSEGGAVALGMVRREVEPPAELAVVWDDHRAPALVLG